MREPQATRRPRLGESSAASGTRGVVRSLYAVERSRLPSQAGAGKRDSFFLSRRVCRTLLAVSAAVLLASCASEPSRDAEQADGPSDIDLKAEDVVDAIPRAEPLARYGNHSPYEVFGRKYHVMQSSAGYHERGTASWYGSKFHGRKTSSGEPYDMHLATAAHKSLPLPTYAEVTNLDNGRKVIVKINDRGPFKDDRLIDLSTARPCGSTWWLRAPRGSKSGSWMRTMQATAAPTQRWRRPAATTGYRLAPTGAVTGPRSLPDGWREPT